MIVTLISDNTFLTHVAVGFMIFVTFATSIVICLMIILLISSILLLLVVELTTADPSFTIFKGVTQLQRVQNCLATWGSYTMSKFLSLGITTEFFTLASCEISYRVPIFQICTLTYFVTVRTG